MLRYFCERDWDAVINGPYLLGAMRQSWIERQKVVLLQTSFVVRTVVPLFFVAIVENRRMCIARGVEFVVWSMV